MVVSRRISSGCDGGESEDTIAGLSQDQRIPSLVSRRIRSMHFVGIA